MRSARAALGNHQSGDGFFFTWPGVLLVWPGRMTVMSVFFIQFLVIVWNVVLYVLTVLTIFNQYFLGFEF